MTFVKLKTISPKCNPKKKTQKKNIKTEDIINFLIYEVKRNLNMQVPQKYLIR